MQVAQRKDGTISFLRVKLRNADHNVELFAVPLLGTKNNYEALRAHLSYSQTYLQWVVINSWANDAMGIVPNSSEIGHGMWSDMAHIIGHKVLDECIPFEEYANASLDWSEAKKLMRLSDENHAKMVSDGKKAFAEYAVAQTYSQRRLYQKIVKALLMYKYSTFLFWSVALKYAKVLDAMASLTADKITLEHYLYNVCAVLDPHAINKTVAKLKGKGYRVISTEYIPFIELSTTK